MSQIQIFLKIVIGNQYKFSVTGPVVILSKEIPFAFLCQHNAFRYTGVNYTGVNLEVSNCCHPHYMFQIGRCEFRGVNIVEILTICSVIQHSRCLFLHNFLQNWPTPSSSYENCTQLSYSVVSKSRLFSLSQNLSPFSVLQSPSFL